MKTYEVHRPDPEEVRAKVDQFLLGEKIKEIRRRGEEIRLRFAWLDIKEKGYEPEERYNHNHDSKGRFASGAGGSCNWTGAKQQEHSKAELNEITEYAKSKGIQIYNPKQFDGDIELLREQIDVISGMKDEWGLTQKITVSFNELDDDDFAITINSSITFNKKVLRDREVTNRNLNTDNALAASDVKGITAHEMGHIISQKYGEKGLDIAKETYYNVYNKRVSDTEICQYLKNNISGYSADEHEVIRGSVYVRHQITYPEITPEVISKNMYGEKSEYSQEYVRILKGRCSR